MARLTCNGQWFILAVTREQTKGVVGLAMGQGRQSSSEVRDKAKGKGRQWISSMVNEEAVVDTRNYRAEFAIVRQKAQSCSPQWLH